MKQLLFTLLTLSILACSNKKTCSDFHEGKFGFTDPDLAHIEITRESGSQIEVNTKTNMEAHTEINWINDCSYELTYVDIKNAPKEFDFMIGKKIKGEIIEMNGNNFTCEVITESTKDSVEYKLLTEN
ncbi:hypothetical protein [Brumimicrobium aurantiacum]|uniref:DNA topoisomerase IV n=1 Tax=Brumimicrobium aurantiacum TaxID=1737063 RepID=A0A3E1EYE6_9FLAO|nr:hypothetical protein [Brumimicrobium aurantiacum]RFC54580.1 hypothetical protein DXU93_06210 [Brumimicrobium aurantiacum]